MSISVDLSAAAYLKIAYFPGGSRKVQPPELSDDLRENKYRRRLGERRDERDEGVGWYRQAPLAQLFTIFVVQYDNNNRETDHAEHRGQELHGPESRRLALGEP